MSLLPFVWGEDAPEYNMVGEGWRAAETAPVLRLFAKPLLTSRGSEISQEYNEQNNQINNQADRERYGNK